MGGRIPGFLDELCPFCPEKIGEFQAITLKFSAFSCVKSNRHYNIQILEEFRVMGHYIFLLFRVLKVIGYYIFQLLEALKVTGRYIFQLFRMLKVTGRYIFQLLETLKITAVSFKK